MSTRAVKEALRYSDHPHDRWDRVVQALSNLNGVYCLKGKESMETKDALKILMEAYDEWLD